MVAALIRQGDRILVSRRRADQSMPGLWELPGGKVEDREAPAAALRREIREELGCTVEVGTIYDVVSHEYPAFDLLMLVYSCRVIGEAQPMAREVAEVKWLPAEDLPRLSLLPADEPLARRLASEAAQARSRPGPYFCP